MSPNRKGYLTPQQEKLLAFLIDFMASEQRPPTRAEIARDMGWNSPASAEFALGYLEREGFIRIVRRHARGIELVDQAVDAWMRGNPELTAEQAGA